MTARFIADFSSFTSAVQKAEVTLKSFETDANKVEKALNRIGDSFSGRKVISDANLMAKAITDIGGASKLTESEQKRVNATIQEALEKYKALGQSAPASLKQLADATSGAAEKASVLGQAFGALAGAAAAGALLNFGRQILADADALTKLRDVTGISIEGLQLLQAAADESGNSLEQVTSAVTQMQNRLAGGDAAAANAVRDLGLAVADLQRLSPDQQFQEIGKALTSIKDPAEQTRIAIDLFGRAGAQVLPTLKANFDAIRESADTMSADTVEALDQVGDGWTRLVRNTKANAAEFLLAVVRNIQPAQAALQEFAREQERLMRMVDQLPEKKAATGVTPGAMRKFVSIDPSQERQIINELDKRMSSATKSAKGLDDGMRKLIEAQEQLAAEGQRLLAVLDRLEIIVPGLRQSVGELDSTELKSISTWLANAKAVDEYRLALQKLSQVNVGSVDVDALGGLDVESIGRLQNVLNNLKAPTASFRDAVSGVASAFQAMSGAGSEAFNRVTSSIASGVSAFGSLKSSIEAIQATTQATTASMILGFANVFTAAFQLTVSILNVFKEHWDAIKAGFQALWGWVVDGFKALGQAILAVFRAIADAIKAIFNGIKNFFGALIGKGWLWGRGGDKDSVPGAATGGIVTPYGIQRFMSGGIVGWPGMGRDNRLIAAHDGELILNQAQQRNVANRLAGGITVTVAPVFNGPVAGSSGREIARLIRDELVQMFAHNEGGSYTRLRGALGMTS